MNTADLLAELNHRGVELRAEGTRLRFRPSVVMPPELLASLREHKAELLAMFGGGEDDALPSVVPTKPPPVMRYLGFVGVDKTCFQKNAEAECDDPLAETHADREVRRFLQVCKPWPDGRGWFDPGSCWLPGVRDHFDAMKRTNPIGSASVSDSGLDPGRPGALDALSKAQLARYQEARQRLAGDDPTAAHARAWREAVTSPVAKGDTSNEAEK